jgi:hypothetical protein
MPLVGIPGFVLPGLATERVVAECGLGDAFDGGCSRASHRAAAAGIARGFGARGSTVEEDTRRELLQEIGAVPKTLDTLGVVYPDLPRTEHSKADEKP